MLYLLTVLCYLIHGAVRSRQTGKFRWSSTKHLTTLRGYEWFRKTVRTKTSKVDHRSLQTKTSEDAQRLTLQIKLSDVPQGLREISWNKIKNVYKRISRIGKQ